MFFFFFFFFSYARLNQRGAPPLYAMPFSNGWRCLLDARRKNNTGQVAVHCWKCASILECIARILRAFVVHGRNAKHGTGIGGWQATERCEHSVKSTAYASQSCGFGFNIEAVHTHPRHPRNHPRECTTKPLCSSSCCGLPLNSHFDSTRMFPRSPLALFFPFFSFFFSPSLLFIHYLFLFCTDVTCVHLRQTGTH